MAKLSQYEIEREANIARNRALLAQLDLQSAVNALPKADPPKTKAKPVQPAKRKREKVEDDAPRRQSARLRKVVADPNESPAKKRKREEEERRKLAQAEEERLEAEERARLAKRPRHQELDIKILAEEFEPEEISTLATELQTVAQTPLPKRVGDIEAYTFDTEPKEESAVVELREKFQSLKVVARAKVTQDRIYSAAYHPIPTKDLIFFGDKHGQLGIWDARAPAEEAADEDGQVSREDSEGGRYWRLQMHWPATSKSSISCIKFNPVDSHSLFTSSYDCTIRCLSFTTGVAREVFATEEGLPTSFDLSSSGNEMWVSDGLGGVTHLDFREEKSKGRWYGLSDQKIGCLSLNSTRPNYMLTASNSKALRIWDIRRLQQVALDVSEPAPMTPPPSSPGGPAEGPSDSSASLEFDAPTISEYLASDKGKGCLRGEWTHGKSVSSAYWDPRGRSIVSTSYDDTLRLWDIGPQLFDTETTFPSSRPFSRISHNCQTGKWLTILRAQWTPNPDVYPHFTVGNMDHSLNVFSCKGDLIARLSDPRRITAVQAVTASHPSVVERVASGNASGRCVLWAPADE